MEPELEYKQGKIRYCALCPAQELTVAHTKSICKTHVRPAAVTNALGQTPPVLYASSCPVPVFLLSPPFALAWKPAVREMWWVRSPYWCAAAVQRWQRGVWRSWDVRMTYLLQLWLKSLQGTPGCPFPCWYSSFFFPSGLGENKRWHGIWAYHNNWGRCGW
jgi:hypothetical protein